MATEFKLPELGENIDSGDLVRLMISPGASIAEGRVKKGDKLRVGQVIFTVENGAGAAATKKSEATPPQPKAAQPAQPRPEAPPTPAVAPRIEASAAPAVSAAP